jgi:hypothetical protein
MAKKSLSLMALLLLVSGSRSGGSAKTGKWGECMAMNT